MVTRGGKMKNNEFHKLTSKNDVDTTVYDSLFQQVFEDSELLNIGITGAYGVGKSSLLESIKRKRNESYIHVTVGASCVDSEENSKLSILEGRIVSQLIQQIDPNRIKMSNFRTKKKISNCADKLRSLWLSVSAILVFYQINFEKIENFTFDSSTLPTKYVELLEFLQKPETFLISLIPTLIALLYLLTVALTKIHTYGITSIALSGATVEISQDEPIFDNNLSEVIYLFENCGSNVIVFEDLDRNNYGVIFQRLKEINYLVNKNNANKKKLRFFYLVKDDIFTELDKTKFFDFIIPVVPLVGGSSNGDFFFNCMKDLEEDKNLDKDFVRNAGSFCKDVRIMKHIANEYAVYNSHFISYAKNENKILALVLLKNLDHNEYNALMNKESILTIFLNEEPQPVYKSSDLAKAISEAKEQIDNHGEENSSSVRTLELLKFLLESQYLSWDYRDYLSYFFNHTLSENDEYFINSLTQGTDVPIPNYKIDNPFVVLEKIDKHSFSTHRNYDLLACLIENEKEFEYEQVTTFLDKVLLEKNLEYILNYVKSDNGRNTKSKFYKRLSFYLKNHYTAIIEDVNNDRKKKSTFFKDCLLFGNRSEIRVLLKHDKNNKIYASLGSDSSTICDILKDSVLDFSTKIEYFKYVKNYDIETSEKGAVLLASIFKDNSQKLDSAYRNIFFVLYCKYCLGILSNHDIARNQFNYFYDRSQMEETYENQSSFESWADEAEKLKSDLESAKLTTILTQYEAIEEKSKKVALNLCSELLDSGLVEFSMPFSLCMAYARDKTIFIKKTEKIIEWSNLTEEQASDFLIACNSDEPL